MIKNMLSAEFCKPYKFELEGCRLPEKSAHPISNKLNKIAFCLIPKTALEVAPQKISLFDYVGTQAKDSRLSGYLDRDFSPYRGTGQPDDETRSG